MPIEGALVDPTKTDETGIYIAPESFECIHMRTTSHEFIFAVIDAEIFPIAHIDQHVIASSPIRIDHTIHRTFPRIIAFSVGFRPPGQVPSRPAHCL